MFPAPLTSLTRPGDVQMPEGISASRAEALRQAALVTRGDGGCAWIDASYAFRPSQAAARGVLLQRLLWVRCTPERESLPWRTRQHEASGWDNAAAMARAWRAAQLLLRTATFPLIVLDGARGQGKRFCPLPSLSAGDRQRRGAWHDEEVLLLFRAIGTHKAPHRPAFWEHRALGLAIPAPRTQTPAGGGKLLAWPIRMETLGA